MKQIKINVTAITIFAAALILTACDFPPWGQSIVMPWPDRNGGGGGEEETSAPPVYIIGDTGLGGGKVFYVNEAGFGPGNAWHYLEAAPADSGGLAWGASGQDVATGTGIGAGAANTAAILAIDANAPAAKACDEYTNGGKDDWFLPSQDELNKMYLNKTAIGDSGFSPTSYWSSSQHSSNVNAYFQNFGDGSTGYASKNAARRVRAVRAF